MVAKIDQQEAPQWQRLSEPLCDRHPRLAVAHDAMKEYHHSTSVLF